MNASAERIGTLLLERFAGRTDCYLSERRKAVREPLTVEIVAAHLAGQDRIGIYQNGSTSYLGFDFDGKNLPGGADEAFGQAQKVSAVLDADLGLPAPSVELTRSGKGYRGIVFFDPEDKPTVAEAKAFGRAVLRAAGLPDDEAEDQGHPGIYPQTPGPRGIGKTTFLPLGGFLNGGVSRFLDPVTREPIDRQESALEDPELVTRAAMLRAFESLREADAEIVSVASAAAIEGKDKPSRHADLRGEVMRLRNLLPIEETREIAYALGHSRGLGADRDGEIENMIVGAYLKAPIEITTEYRRERTGDKAPVVREVSFLDLHDLYTKPAEPIPWQVEGYMSRGESVSLSGEWGSGKSLTALDLAVSLALGQPWMGHVPIVGGPYRVIYLDEENSRPLSERRIRQLLKGRGVSAEDVRSVPLFYATRAGVRLDDSTWYDWLRRQIEGRQGTHLFLDSQIRFARVPENDNTELAAFFGDVIQPLLTEYSLSVLALDHMGKPSKERTDPGHRVRGGSEKPAASDELICMDGERGQATRSITHEKSRWNRYQPALVTTCTESDDEETCWLSAAPEIPDTTDTVFRLIRDSGRQGVLRERLVETLAEINQKGASRYASRALKTLKGQGSIRSKQEGRKVRYWTAENAPDDAE